MAESELLGLAGLRSVAVQSTHIHRVQLLSPPVPTAKPRAAEPGLRVRLQRQWRANAWLLLTLGFLCCLGRLRADAAAATAGPKSRDDDNAVASSSSGDLYIVLVSIPVLDKMLPLKHLAETLLSRGVRVGFALPENCRQWVSDLEGLEFISLGNIVGKGRATALDPTELQTLGVYESYASTLRYYASFQRPMFGPLLEEPGGRPPGPRGRRQIHLRGLRRLPSTATALRGERPAPALRHRLAARLHPGAVLQLYHARTN